MGGAESRIKSTILKTIAIMTFKMDWYTIDKTIYLSMNAWLISFIENYVVC